MSSALANRLRLTRYLRLDYLEHLMFSTIALFLLALVLIMRFVPVTDYLDGVTGRISSASPPLKIRSNGQYRIDKVHVPRDHYVCKGDILIEFAREAPDAELRATDAEIAGNVRELRSCPSWQRASAPPSWPRYAFQAAAWPTSGWDST